MTRKDVGEATLYMIVASGDPCSSLSLTVLGQPCIERCREAWHPQGPHCSTRPPRATTCRGIAPPPDNGLMGVGAGMDNM
jgi:hypothetical protein